MEKGKIYKVKPGQEARIYFTDEGKEYRLITKCIQVINGNQPALRFERDGLIELVQQREYFRIVAEVPVHIKFHAPSNPGKIISEDDFVTKDICGGGLRAGGLPVWTKVGVPVSITIFDSINKPPIVCKGMIVRVSMPDDSGHVEAAIEFNEITEKNRDRVINLVFRLEIENNKP